MKIPFWDGLVRAILKLRTVRFWRERTTNPPNRWKPPSEGRSKKNKLKRLTSNRRIMAVMVYLNVYQSGIYTIQSHLWQLVPPSSQLFYTTNVRQNGNLLFLRSKLLLAFPWCTSILKSNFHARALVFFSGWLNPPQKKTPVLV